MTHESILGMNSDTFYGLLLVILLIILGIVSFQYFVFVKSGNGAALQAGTGFGFTVFPDEERRQMKQ